MICSVKGPRSISDLSPVCFGFATNVSKHNYFIQLDRHGLLGPTLAGPEAINSGEFQTMAMRSRARDDARDGHSRRLNRAQLTARVALVNSAESKRGVQPLRV
jgi:hypothetical protein